MSDRKFKQDLLKEASSRIAPSERVYEFNLSKNESEITSNLYKEARSRLKKLIKYAMGAHTGEMELKNATSNVKWEITPQTANTKKIDDDIYKVFKDYLYMKSSGQKRLKYFVGTYYALPSENNESGDRIELETETIEATAPSSEISPDEMAQYNEMPDANLVLRFSYKRNFLPVTDKVYMKDALNSIKLLTEILPNDGQLNFENFTKDFDMLNFPPLPYSHVTQQAEELGGLGKEQINQLNGAPATEAGRRQPGLIDQWQNDMVDENGNCKLILSDGTPIVSRMYGDLVDRLNNNMRVRPTYSDSINEVVHRDEVDNISSQANLIVAIRTKMAAGYSLNVQDLNKRAEAKFQEWIKFNLGETQGGKFHGQSRATGITINSDLPNKLSPQEKAKIMAYQQLYKNYIDKVVNWFAMKCPTENTGKHTRCESLHIEQARDALWCLSDKNEPLQGRPEQKEQRAGFWKSQLAGDKIILKRPLVVRSNGLDSLKSKNGQWTRMGLIPPLKAVKDQYGNSKIIPNTDQVNLGRAHLIYNGRTAENFINKWGAWCDECFKVMQGSRGTNPVARMIQANNEKNGFALGAWMTTIGGKAPNGHTYGNRTGAEAILELMSKYNNYKDFYKNFLKEKSLANRGEREVTSYQEENMMGPSGFDGLKQYGYQISKMMDFSSALMETVCREEVSPGRYKYATGYSTGSSKGDHGEVVVGVKYAFNAIDVGQTPEAKEQLKKQYQARHIKYSEGNFPIRETMWPQKGKPAPEEFQPDPSTNTTIMSDITYWIGVSSSERKFKKTYDSIPTWDLCIGRLLSLYPDIEYQLHSAIEPINVDLQSIERSCQLAFDKAADDIREAGLEVKSDFGGDTDNDPMAALLPEEQPQPAAPIDPVPVEVPGVPGIPTPTPTPIGSPEEVTEVAPESYTEDKSMKAKPMDGFMPQFIGKKNDKRRRLLKSLPIVSKTDTIGNLTKVANMLDQKGEIILANKIDFIASKIIEAKE